MVPEMWGAQGCLWEGCADGVWSVSQRITAMHADRGGVLRVWMPVGGLAACG